MYKNLGQDLQITLLLLFNILGISIQWPFWMIIFNSLIQIHFFLLHTMFHLVGNSWNCLLVCKDHTEYVCFSNEIEGKVKFPAHFELLPTTGWLLLDFTCTSRCDHLPVAKEELPLRDDPVSGLCLSDWDGGAALLRGESGQRWGLDRHSRGLCLRGWGWDSGRDRWGPHDQTLCCFFLGHRHHAAREHKTCYYCAYYIPHSKILNISALKKV